jgi:hypothetical protein
MLSGRACGKIADKEQAEEIKNVVLISNVSPNTKMHRKRAVFNESVAYICLFDYLSQPIQIKI